MRTRLTETERDNIARATGIDVAGGQFDFTPETMRSNWGGSPHMIVKHSSGRRRRYYRWPEGHPRSWVKQFAGDIVAGVFA